MQNTTNYSLKKLEDSDAGDLKQFNTNWDTVDAELADRATLDQLNGKASTTYQGSGIAEFLDESLVLNTTTTVDGNGRVTNLTEKRADTTTYHTVDYSNFDGNNKPQTVVEKWYDTNGTTLLKTNTYTNTYNANGVLTASSGVRT